MMGVLDNLVAQSTVQHVNLQFLSCYAVNRTAFVIGEKFSC